MNERSWRPVLKYLIDSMPAFWTLKWYLIDSMPAFWTLKWKIGSLSESGEREALGWPLPYLL
jgi:hypothetical protein